MAQKIVAAFEYSDNELLAILREAHATVANKGQSYTHQGMTYTRASLSSLSDQISQLENKIAMASGGIVSQKVRLSRG